ncbi:MAG: hypothetical protein U9R16_03190 [Campylobacterota bacterium]|nr:hypothetical protein [Campylobacterota bacterium]
MEQLTGTALTNYLLAELIAQKKITNSYLKQIANERIIDTFSIKSLEKASLALDCCRQTLVKAIKDKKLKIGFDYLLSSSGRYSFSDYLEQNFKGKI